MYSCCSFFFFDPLTTSSALQECVHFKQHDLIDGPNHSQEIGGLRYIPGYKTSFRLCFSSDPITEAGPRAVRCPSCRDD